MTSPVTHEQGTAPSPPAPAAQPPDAVSSAPRWRRRAVLPRALVILLGAGAAVLVLAGVRSVAWLIGPIFLALIIVIALKPVQTWLLRRGWPAWVTTLVLIVLVTGVLVVLGLVFVVSIARLAALVPQY